MDNFLESQNANREGRPERVGDDIGSKAYKYLKDNEYQGLNLYIYG